MACLNGKKSTIKGMEVFTQTEWESSYSKRNESVNFRLREIVPTQKGMKVVLQTGRCG